MLWDPAICRSVVPAVAVPGESFRIRDLDAEVFVILEDAEPEHMLITREQRCVQLVVRGGTVLSPCRLLTNLEIPPVAKQIRLDAISEFNVLAESGTLSNARSYNCVSVEQLRFVLRALDAWLAGASQRTIAEALYGAPRALRD